MPGWCFEGVYAELNYAKNTKATAIRKAPLTVSWCLTIEVYFTPWPYFTILFTSVKTTLSS